MGIGNQNKISINPNLNNNFEKDEKIEETSFLNKKRMKSDEVNIENKIIQINNTVKIKSPKVKAEQKCILLFFIYFINR